MNQIEFKLAKSKEHDSLVVRIVVDGLDLIERLKEVESPFANAELHPNLAGAYDGLTAADWDDLPEAYGDGRVAALACECGEVGCWPLRVRISEDEHTVKWGDFAQPHRPNWRYDQLGPFVFARAEYERAVQALRTHDA